jgi:hypothetical protein
MSLQCDKTDGSEPKEMPDSAQSGIRAAGCSTGLMKEARPPIPVGVKRILWDTEMEVADSEASSPEGLTPYLGVLSSGRSGSMGILVLCDELASLTTRFAAGIEVAEDTNAADVVHRAAAYKVYLRDPNSLNRHQIEIWIPAIFRRESPENWCDQE